MKRIVCTMIIDEIAGRLGHNYQAASVGRGGLQQTFYMNVINGPPAECNTLLQ
jgi:hypothetical protein